jgi:hypothetical protein
MTQHILLISNYLYSSIAFLLTNVYNIVASLFSAIERGQQARAEYEVARMLHREHRGEDFSHILYMVREGRHDELVK